jgi:sugar/nucleoside kinase (ribokinase family)
VNDRVPTGEPTRDMDILVIGEINPDIVIADPDPVPVFGEVERVVRSVVMTVGSSSAIFACGAARLGLRVGFVGVVGDDAFGRFMLDAMAGRGVDVAACTVDPTRPTGATVILSSGRDRAMLTAMGTIGALDVDRVPDGLLARARHLHLSCFYLQETSRERLPGFFAAARARGLTTSFDTNWDPTERWDGGVHAMLQAADVFFPNEAEATRIARIADPEKAARALASGGGARGGAGAGAAEAGAGGGPPDRGPIVVVKRGADGALASRAGEAVVRVPAMPVDPIDTTGAGDSFDAGFLRSWLDGASIAASLEFAAACGAISTRSVGGVDGQPTFAEATAAVEAWRAIRGRSQ